VDDDQANALMSRKSREFAASAVVD